jgi:hypothetical protein
MGCQLSRGGRARFHQGAVEPKSVSDVNGKNIEGAGSKSEKTLHEGIALLNDSIGREENWVGHEYLRRYWNNQEVC